VALGTDQRHLVGHIRDDLYFIGAPGERGIALDKRLHQQADIAWHFDDHPDVGVDQCPLQGLLAQAIPKMEEVSEASEKEQPDECEAY
jgi:hypothetical protein